MKTLRLITQRSSVQFDLPRRSDDQDQQRHTETAQLSHEPLSCFVPVLQDTNAAANGGNVIEHELFKHLKAFVGAIGHRREDFQCLIRVAKTATSGKTVGLRSEEHTSELH